MFPIPFGVQGEFRAIAGMENQLVDKLGEAKREVAHAECFDSEQRAEVYTILDALEADTNAHKKAINTLQLRLSETACDA